MSRLVLDYAKRYQWIVMEKYGWVGHGLQPDSMGLDGDANRFLVSVIY